MTRVTTFMANDAPGRMRQGAIGILPTDAGLCLVGSATSPKAVARLAQFAAKDEPCVVLLAAADEAGKFGVPPEEHEDVEPFWPGPLSVIFSYIGDDFDYLRWTYDSPQFRVPDHHDLKELIAESGPLVAVSLAADQQLASLGDIARTFGDTIDFAIDGDAQGIKITLAKVSDGQLVVLEQGAMFIAD